MALTFADKSKEFAERPGKLNYVKVDEELDKKIKAALDEWVLSIYYDVTYDDDDGEYTSSDLRYKELNEPNIVVVNGAPVGILLEHIVYENNNSSCTYTYLYVLYFKDAGARELKLEGTRSGHRYVSGTAYYSLKRRSELGEKTKVESATSEFFPVPKVF